MHLQDGWTARWESEKLTANQRWWYVTSARWISRAPQAFIWTQKRVININHWRGEICKRKGLLSHTAASVSSSFVWLNGAQRLHKHPWPNDLSITVSNFLPNLIFLFSITTSCNSRSGGGGGGIPGVHHPHNLYRHNKPREAGCFSLELQSPYKPWLMKSWDVVCL